MTTLGGLLVIGSLVAILTNQIAAADRLTDGPIKRLVSKPSSSELFHSKDVSSDVREEGQQGLKQFINSLQQVNNKDQSYIFGDIFRRLGDFGPRQNRVQVWSTKFSCKAFNRSQFPEPTSVHRLTPANIDVVGALGDSLTAGTGVLAENVLGILRQYRGRVYCIGGDEDFDSNPSLVNILRKYNPHVTGYSIKTGKDSDADRAGFNLAVPATTTKDLMNQANNMIDRMKSELGSKFSTSWKMVTILMGQNDIGVHCKKENKGVYTAENYRKRFKAVLDHLKQNLPRTLVNVVTMLDVFLAQELNIGTICKTVHLFEGICSTYPKDYNAVKNLTNQFQQTVEDLIKSGRYDGDDNFTVVTHPFFKQTYFPRTKDGKVDLSYFAPDCFHFSQKGHNAAALALWNSLFEPVGSKRTSWVPGEDYECPTVEQPYIATSMK